MYYRSHVVDRMSSFEISKVPGLRIAEPQLRTGRAGGGRETHSGFPTLVPPARPRPFPGPARPRVLGWMSGF